MGRFKRYLALLRCHQYLKNAFILLPPFFGGRMADTAVMSRALYACAAFSAIASAIYIFNDIKDVETDRNHPVKKYRPIASGAISVKTASWIMAALLIPGLWFSRQLGFFALAIFYVLLNTAYTLKIKQIAILDVLSVSAGFALRLFIGGAATGIPLSMWIVLITFLLALFLALAKRMGDYMPDARVENKNYSREFLLAATSIAASVVIMAYMMYTCSSEVMARVHSDKIYVTAFFVIAGLLRYLQLVFVLNEHYCPTEILSRDIFLQSCIAAWLGCFAFFIYA